MATELAKAVLKNVPMTKVAWWILAGLTSRAVAENLGSSASALRYRVESMETLAEAAEDYYKAYERIQNSFDEHGRPLSGPEAFANCSRFSRLPEIEELEQTIQNIREQAEVSATLEDEIVMRIEADREDFQRRAEAHLQDTQQVQQMSRSQINVRNPDRTRELAARLATLRAYGQQVMADERRQEREETEDLGDYIQDIGAQAIGNLEAIKSAMRRQDGPFVYLDSGICDQWEAALEQ